MPTLANNIPITAKLDEIQREIAQRVKVYGRLVKEGKMYANTANYRIEVMKEIENDYKRAIRGGQLSIF